jgi:protein SCO1
MNFKNKVLTTIIVLFLVVVVPILSYLILRKADKVRQERRVPDFQFISHTGDSVSSAGLRGSVYLAGFIYANCEHPVCDNIMNGFRALQDTFANRPDFKLLVFTINPDADSVAALKEFAEKNGCDGEKWKFLYTETKSKIFPLIIGGFMGKVKEGNAEDHSLTPDVKVVLVNKNGFIRAYFSLEDDRNMRRAIKTIRKYLDEPTG